MDNWDDHGVAKGSPAARNEPVRHHRAVLHYSRERYRLLATESAERRIRWAVAYLASSIGSSEGNATVVTRRSVQRDIADLAETTIYTVNRVLNDYERRGILTKKRGRIVLSGALQMKQGATRLPPQSPPLPMGKLPAHRTPIQ
jgi:hypothetical protein